MKAAASRPNAIVRCSLISSRVAVAQYGAVVFLTAVTAAKFPSGSIADIKLWPPPRNPNVSRNRAFSGRNSGAAPRCHLPIQPVHNRPRPGIPASNFSVDGNPSSWLSGCITDCVHARTASGTGPVINPARDGLQ